MADRKYVVVVGRSENLNSFEKEVSDCLTDNFEFELIAPLGEWSDVDKKERFLSFISGEDLGNASAALVQNRIQSMGYAANICATVEDAVEFAKDKYGFDQEAALQERLEKIEELKEKYPPPSAAQLEEFMVFDSLYHTGKITPLNGRFNGENVVILSLVVRSAEETSITPIAVMLTDSIKEDIEFPWTD